MNSSVQYKGWNFNESKWEDVTKEVYDTLLDPARCIVPVPGDGAEAKARELVEKFFMELQKGTDVPERIKAAKQCALIACDLLITENTGIENMVGQGFYLDFWKQVRTHILAM